MWSSCSWVNAIVGARGAMITRKRMFAYTGSLHLLRRSQCRSRGLEQKLSTSSLKSRTGSCFRGHCQRAAFFRKLLRRGRSVWTSRRPRVWGLAQACAGEKPITRRQISPSHTRIYKIFSALPFARTHLQAFVVLSQSPVGRGIVSQTVNNSRLWDIDWCITVSISYEGKQRLSARRSEQG